MSLGKKECVIGFNYKSLNADVAIAVKKATSTIKRKIATTVIDVGRELAIIKQQLDHGQFTAWLRSELNFSTRTAERYMQAARLADKNDMLRHLQPTVLYALAAPNVAKSIQATVISKLEKGEQVPLKEVRQMLQNDYEARNKVKPRPSGGTKRTGDMQKQRVHADSTLSSDEKLDGQFPPKQAQMFQMKTGVGIKVVKRLPPADKDYFWGRIHHRGDHLMIIRLAKGKAKQAPS